MSESEHFKTLKLTVDQKNSTGKISDNNAGDNNVGDNNVGDIDNTDQRISKFKSITDVQAVQYSANVNRLLIGCPILLRCRLILDLD